MSKLQSILNTKANKEIYAFSPKIVGNGHIFCKVLISLYTCKSRRYLQTDIDFYLIYIKQKPDNYIFDNGKNNLWLCVIMPYTF